VPNDTPTLALDDEFELRVESVFVVLSKFTWFLAINATSLAFTSEPAMVTLPLPGVPLPVAMKVAVPPAWTDEPRCVV
jgi:hypothetical protein